MKKSEFRLLLMKVRLEQNKTQESLARDLGISQKSVSMWENGESIPRGPMRVKLAQVLNLPLDYFMEIEDAEPKESQTEYVPENGRKKLQTAQTDQEKAVDALLNSLDDEGLEMLITKLKNYRT